MKTDNQVFWSFAVPSQIFAHQRICMSKVLSKCCPHQMEAAVVTLTFLDSSHSSMISSATGKATSLILLFTELLVRKI